MIPFESGSPVHLQFCKGEEDITGDFYAAEDADAARLWTENGDLIAEFTLETNSLHRRSWLNSATGEAVKDLTTLL